MKQETLNKLNLCEDHERECKLANGDFLRAYGRHIHLLLIPMEALFCLELGSIGIPLRLRD